MNIINFLGYFGFFIKNQIDLFKKSLLKKEFRHVLFILFFVFLNPINNLLNRFD